jgi:hypothetical protein
MIPERFWTFRNPPKFQKDSGPFPEPSEGNWGQSCKFRKFRKANLEHSGGEMAEVKITGGNSERRDNSPDRPEGVRDRPGAILPVGIS